MPASWWHPSRTQWLAMLEASPDGPFALGQARVAGVTADFAHHAVGLEYARKVEPNTQGQSTRPVAH